jgi:hypothetical protein
MYAVPTGAYEDFATGFVVDDARASRPLECFANGATKPELSTS